MNLGVDELLSNREMRKPLADRRLAFLGHAASMTGDCRHTLDALMECPDLHIASAFGPQHGMRGEKQDNMAESEDFDDPRHRIPVFSLYGRVRRPAKPMLDTFDAVLVDLQDIGTRIYTYVTALTYMLEACARQGKSVWILDRPNPAGRPVEGTILEKGWESYVGAAPLIMRHGMTLGELAAWIVKEKSLDVELEVVVMSGYDPGSSPGYGWPAGEICWVNPSPNASSLNMARCYPGTVLVEGTTLSEGRGTATPLEVVGAPDLDFTRILNKMNDLASDWMQGCSIRPCFFEPVFHKHAARMCAGIQIHTDNIHYRHQRFRPYRLIALLLKAVRLIYPEYPLWREFEYEYEKERLAIDLLSGGTFLREWVDDPAAACGDFDERLRTDEQQWSEMRSRYLVY